MTQEQKEREGASNNHPKFENFPTVVSLLFLACTHIASLTDYSASNVAKIIVRHKIASIRTEGICFPAVINSRKANGKGFFREWKHPEVSLLGCEAAGSTM